MVKDFPSPDSPVGAIIAREVASSLAWGLLYPFGIHRTRKRTPRRKDQRTVVFVHGYGANRASFLPLAAYLRALGIGPVLSFNYRFGTGIEKAASELKEFLRQHVRGGRIDLVCHSLGGVIARLYVQELGGARRVDRCITLGTPHQGTYNSYWVPTGVGRDLRPDSSLMARLKASHAAGTGVEFTSIVGGSDNIVIPRVFGVAGEDVVQVPGVGHVGLLFSPSTFQTVARRLLLPR